MKSLEMFFVNVYLKLKVANVKLYKFASDHLQRLVGDPDPGRFAAIIDPLKTALDNYSAAFMGKDTSQSMRQSHTKAINQLVARFKAKVRQFEGAVISQWGIDAPEYQQFFPAGRTEYTRCSKGTIETLLNRLITACNAHAADLGATYLAEFTDMLAVYVAARDAQVATKGNVSVSSVMVAELRAALCRQLFLNTLFLANLFVDNLAEGKAYFDFSLLNGRKHKNGKPTDTMGVVNCTITDAATGEGLPNVFVSAEGLETDVVSDEDGDLYITDVPPGTYTFVFTCEDYTSLTYERAVVVAGQETAIELVMEKAMQLSPVS
jgi:hypothetical protein